MADQKQTAIATRDARDPFALLRQMTSELDRAFVERIGGRIAAYVSALEPLLRAEVPSDVAWREARPRR